MAFEMVGVQLDQPGNNIVAAHILADAARAKACAGFDAGDKAVAQHQRTFDDLVGKHDAGIVENSLGGHFRQSFRRFFWPGGARARDARAP